MKTRSKSNDNLYVPTPLVRKRRFPGCLSGAFGELECATELLRRGFFVFRNVSAQGRNDLVCEYAGRLYGVQVKFRQPVIRGGTFVIQTGGLSEYEQTDIHCYVGGSRTMLFETKHRELQRVLSCRDEDRTNKRKGDLL